MLKIEDAYEHVGHTVAIERQGKTTSGTLESVGRFLLHVRTDPHRKPEAFVPAEITPITEEG